MRLLFLLVWLLHSFIFYYFYTYSLNKDLYLNDLINPKNITILSLKDNIIFSWQNNIVMQSFFWNIAIEVWFFIFLTLFLIFLFTNVKSRHSWQKIDFNHDEDISDDNENTESEAKTWFFKSIFNLDNFKYFIKKFSYYFWFLLFYVSLYIISLSFPQISFSGFILFLNILIYLYFFASKFSQISRDFLKVNSILFSVWYLISYIFIIYTNINFFSWIDFFNSFLIIFSFPTLIYYDKFVLENKQYDNTIVVHFSLYIFWVFLFYFYHYLLNENLVFYLSILCSLFGLFWFEYIPKIKLFENDYLIFRYIWIIFNYFWILFWIIYLFINFSYLIFIILLWQAIYNFYIHKNYTNYISFIISIFLFLYCIYFFIFNFSIFDFKSIEFFYFNLILSILLIIYTYLFKAEIYLDYFIIHIFSYLINIIWIILFFVFIKFEILYIWILLFVESIYFFLSYFRLTKKS